MTLLSNAWRLGRRRDGRTRRVLVVTFAALIFGLALQSARACIVDWGSGGSIRQATAQEHEVDVDDTRCHHDGSASLDVCLVHCEQDGQAARGSSDPGADDLRLVGFDAGDAYARGQAPRAVWEPTADALRLHPPTYLVLHRLNR